MSDLLSSKLRTLKLDELKIRALILFSFFEAYREQSVEGALDEPLVIECGMDDEKVAVGVSFSLKNAADFKTEGLQERITQSRVAHPFEALIGMIYANSDHTIIRLDTAQSRIEIISLLAIPGKFELGERQPLTIVEQVGANVVEPLQAKEYVQLADLEYTELLKDEGQKSKKKAAFSTGEILSKKFSAPAAEKPKATVVKGTGENESEISEVRISTKPDAVQDDVVRISGGNEAESKKPLLRAVKAQATPEEPQQKNAVAGEGFSVQELIKKVWPFKRKKPLENENVSDPSVTSEAPIVGATSVVSGEVPTPSADAAPAATSEPDKAEGVSEDVTGDENDPKVIAQHLSQNFASGSFSQFVDRTQEMAREIKRDSKDQAAQRWAEGLSQQVMAEKVRLAGLSQKINQAIRQKEQDLKKREQKFAEDLRRKEEALHQKSAALSRAKDQVAQLTAQIEKQKNVKGPAGEDANFKHKYQLSQRMILSMREENTKLAAKLEEAKSQSSTTHKASESTAQVELANLKTKHDQLVREKMQLKGLNDQLMRRMSQSAAKANEKNDRSAVEEMKKKYESAAKQSEQHQKDLVQLKGKLDKLSKEEARWTADLAKKDAELRRTKTELEQLQASMKAGKADKAEKADKVEKKAS